MAIRFTNFFSRSRNLLVAFAISKAAADDDFDVAIVEEEGKNDGFVLVI